jgi:hypothetical protein
VGVHPAIMFFLLGVMLVTEWLGRRQPYAIAHAGTALKWTFSVMPFTMRWCCSSSFLAERINSSFIFNFKV